MAKEIQDGIIDKLRWMPMNLEEIPNTRICSKQEF